MANVGGANCSIIKTRINNAESKQIYVIFVQLYIFTRIDFNKLKYLTIVEGKLKN